jgi:hypothetical protein
MPRFNRAHQEPEVDQDTYVTDEKHPELVGLIQAYSSPLVPNPDSPLSVREQHLVGIVRPRVVRDVAWRRLA